MGVGIIDRAAKSAALTSPVSTVFLIIMFSLIEFYTLEKSFLSDQLNICLVRVETRTAVNLNGWLIKLLTFELADKPFVWQRGAM